MAILTDALNALFRLALRLLFIAAGAVFAASLLLALLVAVAFWMLRAGWARLSGRPVRPWAMRFDPRAGWGRFRQAGARAAAAAPARARAPIGDVTDVEIKRPLRR